MDRAALDRWLSGTATGDHAGPVAHLRLIQRSEGVWRNELPALMRYFEDAHRDARRVFHEEAGLSLDPLAGSPLQYPNAMPSKTRRGYFGEVICGLIATQYELVTRRQWQVPAFLFRYHNAAGEYLVRCLNGDAPNANVPGRTGSDCIAIAVDAQGAVAALLVGEAKCHATLNLEKAREGLEALGAETCLPVSLGQLRKVLSDLPGTQNVTLLDSIATLVFTRPSPAIPRIDLLLYAFDNPGVVTYSGPRITTAIVQAAYAAHRPLHIVELHSPDLTQLIDSLYDRLYEAGGGNDAAS